MLSKPVELPCAVQISNLSKTFGKRKALDNISFKVNQGEMIALIGPSGSGKSTLLRHISALIKPDKVNSRIRVFNRVIQENGKISPDIRQVRAEMGFIFQQFNLVGRMTLLKNVCVGLLAQIPLWRSILQYFTVNEKREAMKALKKVGLEEHAMQRACTLSGGQQQRASIARAMQQKAKIILADEPIASLDPESARKVMELLLSLNIEYGVSVLISLHQIQFALQYCNRSIALNKGKIVYDGLSKNLTPDLLKEIYGMSISEIITDGTDSIDNNDCSNTIISSLAEAKCNV